MTIAEIIAAKKAANAKFKDYVADAYAKHPSQPTAADLEVEAAINRIDPPGKRRAGLVISSKTPLQPAVIAEKAAHKENRSLSRTNGEAIPMVPINADPEQTIWHAASNAFETELCVMRDPTDSEAVWLAIRPYRDGMPPILLHRLPWLLWDYPHQPTDSQPF
jgi:phosphatidate phosphatase APP1